MGIWRDAVKLGSKYSPAAIYSRNYRRGVEAVSDNAEDVWNVASGKAAARDASKELQRGLDKQLAFDLETRDQQMALNEPWRQAGLGALGQLGQDEQFQFTPEDYQAEQFTGQAPEWTRQAPEFNFQADPGYQFRLAEGQKALERSAAARGGLLGAGTVRRLSDLSGQMASNEFDRARGRFQEDRGQYNADRNFFNTDRAQFNADRDYFDTNRRFGYGVYSDRQNARRQSLNDYFNRLSTLAGYGNAATGRAGQAQGAYGQAAGTNALDRGNAQAAATVGAYNTQLDTVMGLWKLAGQIGGMAIGGPAGAAAAGGAAPTNTGDYIRNT